MCTQDRTTLSLEGYTGTNNNTPTIASSSFCGTPVALHKLLSTSLYYELFREITAPESYSFTTNSSLQHCTKQKNRKKAYDK
mmetsp:Transcript_9614/g.12523  ORF Transcript_9614/g.12523 Transcript_9614/m.12523 type:complete len:82 (+) Transcript_9614:650-895(+)